MRGMKQWRPFASLPEYKTEIDKMLEEREKVEKPILSIDQIYDINEVLYSLKCGDYIYLKRYFNGKIYSQTSKLLELDKFSGRLILDNGIVELNDLIDLKLC